MPRRALAGVRGRPATATCIAVLAWLLPLACRTTKPPQQQLIATVLFYKGHVVGRENLAGGLQIAEHDGAPFRTAAWPDLNAKDVDVGPDGRWIAVACGNGVMVSRDGGQSFRLTGGIDVTEVQGVCLDRDAPSRGWAATAYGVFACEDLWDGPWRPARGGFRFCTQVLQDPSRPDVLWAATERGVHRSVDRGTTFTVVSQEAAVRQLAFSSDGTLWAATDGDGLWRSDEAGRTWGRVPGVPDVTYSVTQVEREVWVGAVGAVWVSRDEGRSFVRGDRGLPDDVRVYGIERGSGGRAFLATSDGVFVGDRDSTWQRHGLAGAIVPRIRLASLRRDHARGPATTRGLLSLAGRREPGAGVRADPDAAFDERRQRLLGELGGRPLPSDPSKLSFFSALAALGCGEAGAALWEALAAKLARPQRSMFFSLPAIAVWLHGRDRMPPALRERFREVLTRTPFYRGDTENHWLMHYTALLLTAESWPETSAADWYTGLHTQRNHDEARAWIDRWLELTTTLGQGEFDSPGYLFMFVTPMLLLQEFAADSALRRHARMAVDLLLADYLSESLGGAWCGGHSRIYPNEVTLGAHNRVSAYHWLYAGGIPQPQPMHDWLAVAGVSNYRPAALLGPIANDRSVPYVHRETKRVRNVIRYASELNPPVSKYTYMTDVFGIGSLQGGLLQPVQQHTWDVTWRSEARNPTLFTVHPYYSGRELGMFFPEDPHLLVDLVDATKTGYASADKWVASSPYERVWQDRNVLYALYRLPADDGPQEVSLYWPECLERTEAEGWLLGADGDFQVAVFPCQPGAWERGEGHERLRCRGRRAGFVVVAGRRSETDFGAFRRAVLARGPVELSEHDGDGDLLLQAADADGRPVTVSWERGVVGRQRAEAGLYDGPFMRSALGSRVIELRYRDEVEVLDFRPSSR